MDRNTPDTVTNDAQELGLRPRGSDGYHCTCGAYAHAKKRLEHQHGCEWLRKGGDPNVSYFLRVQPCASIMASMGTLKASFLGARIADFVLEIHGRDSLKSNEELEALMLDFMETPALPRDVMTALVRSFILRWIQVEES